ncbi:cupin domain-containing protein [Patescibacteria group bacterium]|nr:cupin domain-containing protein [Patescibacteria group bacterium]
MKGYVDNIEKATLENMDYRRVLYTGKHSQLVVISIKPRDEIGNEVHEDIDQFIRIEKGRAKLVLNNEDEQEVGDDFGIVIPSGTYHNIINIGEEDLKLYSIYSPPEHKEGTIHSDKENAEEEHFDGETTE